MVLLHASCFPGDLHGGLPLFFTTERNQESDKNVIADYSGKTKTCQVLIRNKTIDDVILKFETIGSKLPVIVSREGKAKMTFWFCRKHVMIVDSILPPVVYSLKQLQIYSFAQKEIGL